MAIDPATSKKLLSILTGYMAEQIQVGMSPSQLDEGYNSLTFEEKTAIIKSVLGNGENAKNIVMIKLQAPIREAAQAQAQAYIDSNLIPLDVIAGLLVRGK